jgi:hypothetical protein
VQSTHDAPQCVFVSHVWHTFASHHSPLPPLQSVDTLQSTHDIPSVLHTSLVAVQSVQLVPQCASTSHATHVCDEHHWPVLQWPSTVQSTHDVPLHTSLVAVQSRHDVPQCASTSHATQSSPEQ